MSRFQIGSVIGCTLLTLSIIALGLYQTLSLSQLKAEIAGIKNRLPDISQSDPKLATSPFPDIATIAAQPATIQTQLDQLTRRLDSIERLPSPTPLKVGKAQTAPFQKQVLTLGAANSSNLSWSPTGLEMNINSADYPAYVMAYFEAGLSCVNGISQARLINQTTGAIINITEVSNNTNIVTCKKSLGFKLYPGNNSYLVQLRSSSGEVVYLSGSQIDIEKQ